MGFALVRDDHGAMAVPPLEVGILDTVVTEDGFNAPDVIVPMLTGPFAAEHRVCAPSFRWAHENLANRGVSGLLEAHSKPGSVGIRLGAGSRDSQGPRAEVCHSAATDR